MSFPREALSPGSGDEDLGPWSGVPIQPAAQASVGRGGSPFNARKARAGY